MRGRLPRSSCGFSGCGSAVQCGALFLRDLNMEASERFEASCLCGGIQLSYSGELGPSNYCHCEDCRKANGSAFNIGVRVHRRDLEVRATTEMRSYEFVSDSGRKIERCFCGTCGSPIYTLHPALPEYA